MPSGAERASREGGVGAELVRKRRLCDENAQAASVKVDRLDLFHYPKHLYNYGFAVHWCRTNVSDSEYDIAISNSCDSPLVIL